MNIPYLLLSKHIHTRDLVRPILNQHGHILSIYYDEAVLKPALEGNDFVVVLLEHNETYDVYELCGEISLSHPHTPIILLLPETEIDLKKAMYVGATDVIAMPFDVLEFSQAAKKAESYLEVRFEKTPKVIKEGRIITICSTKGGVGKTTISVNLATTLAKQKQTVVVLDLDLQFGDVAIMFDIEPKRTIYEWIKESYEAGKENIEDYITPTKFGTDILAAPNLPEFAELVTGEHVAYILDHLRKRYDVIIIDTPPALVETVIVALEHSQEILLITSMDLPTLKNGKLAIETLELLGLKDRIKVILNRDTEMEGMKVEYAEEILGLKVYARVASDYKTVVSSSNKGVPFVLSDTKSNVAKGVISLSEKITAKEHVQAETKEKKKWYSLLLTKERG